MDIAAYIESGRLEAYALGSLPPEESREVAATLLKHPELAKELAAIESSLISFASRSAKEIPFGFDDKIWNAISTEKQAGEAHNQPKIVPLPSGKGTGNTWKYAAAIIGLSASLALNVFLWSNNSKTTSESAVLALKMDSLNTQQMQLAQVLSYYQKAKAMMADTAMLTIVMHTMQKGHPMAATLYWSKDKAEAYVSVDGLPAPPPGMQYQLWAISDGKPVDMGVLPVEMANTPSIHKVNKPIASSEAFAISLEISGGSSVPTAGNIYVLGKA